MNPPRILLTQDKYAVVDVADYEYLNQWKWHYSHGYAQRSINVKRFDTGQQTKTVRMHRQIMGDSLLEVDHINGDKLDNRRTNLRFCTKKENQQNRSVHKNKRFKGVSWHKRMGRWQVAIRVDGKLKHIGTYISEVETAKAYNASAITHFGEYARLNNV